MFILLYPGAIKQTYVVANGEGRQRACERQLQTSKIPFRSSHFDSHEIAPIIRIHHHRTASAAHYQQSLSRLLLGAGLVESVNVNGSSMGII